MKRTVILYLVTVIVMVPLDILFLGYLAKGFFQSQVGDMLGGLRLLPAVVFYLLYAVGILVFVSGAEGTTMRSALIYGALFGMFAYATFDLTALAILKHWTWSAAFVDVAWGAIVTAASAAAGLAVANAFVKAKFLSCPRLSRASRLGAHCIHDRDGRDIR